MASTAFRFQRRSFLRSAGGFGAGLVATSALAGCGGGTDRVAGAAPSAALAPDTVQAPVLAVSADTDTLNFALNLQYLAAHYYAYATTGSGVAASSLAGTGTVGEVRGGRAVTFSDPQIAQHASEIAADKSAHLATLRTVLGAGAVEQPTIDLTGGALAGAAKLGRAGGAFDPFAGDDNFLLGAFLFEETIAAAYRGFLPQLSAAAPAQAAIAGLADTTYHAGLVRGSLVARADSSDGVKASLSAASAALARLSSGVTITEDQSTALSDPAGPNILDVDQSAIPYSRAKTQVIAALYGSINRSPGGFYPKGINGMICTLC